jgi:hypothetical protein
MENVITPTDDKRKHFFWKLQQQRQRKKEAIVIVDHGGNRDEQPGYKQDDSTKATAPMPTTSGVAHVPLDFGNDVPCECWEQSPQTVVFLGNGTATFR